eukprot:13478021-Alexandrium_andersonii.AAC.1
MQRGEELLLRSESFLHDTEAILQDNETLLQKTRKMKDKGNANAYKIEELDVLIQKGETPMQATLQESYEE